VLGQELNTLASRKVPYFRRNLGVVFQDFRLLPNKTVFDNVAFSLQVIGKSKGFIQEAVPDVLKMVGLAGKQQRFPHELSGGEQQRVAIARAVVNKPAILLADEPTGNLDPSTSAGIMTLLSVINANGTTVLMATHDVGIVDQMQRRVIELVSGQIVRDERGGGYQTQAVPVIRQPHQPTRPVQTVDSIIEDAGFGASAPAPVTSPFARPRQPEPSTPAQPERSAPPQPAAGVSAPESTPSPAPAQPEAPAQRDTPAQTDATTAPAANTGAITIVEPAVTNVREVPLANRPQPQPHVKPAPASDDLPDEPTPLVPPPLNEPGRR
jgi:cell division transport system ATP-binding protein